MTAIVLTACGVPSRATSPPPTPTTATLAPPAATAVATLDAESADVQDAFLTNVNDLTDQVGSLASASCADLKSEIDANPTEVGQIHGFASTLQRVGANQAALNTDDVRAALAALSNAITQLDTALNTCGITPQKTSP
ncbi:MAG TPA: hypothetical protein VF937_09015 [Chloroflexota bacterium]